MKRHLPLALTILLLGGSSGPAASSAPAADPGSERPSSAPRLVVYCFHGQFRCITCLRMEEYSRDTLDEHFSDDTRSGRIVFRAVNIAAPEHQHFIADYQLASWSVVLSLEEEGKETRHRNLATIRNLVKDRRAFIRYLFREIEAFLGRG